LGEARVRGCGPQGLRLDGVAADDLSAAGAEELARALAPLRLDERSSARPLGDVVRLGELLGLPAAGARDVGQSWAPRPRSPLRLDAAGDPVVLDLKEAAADGMGPHGLIVGATGSGKSELLRTLVASLAATHSPELLNFVFIDFKGGAAFAEFASLPHAAGMI